jgi:phage gp36-like protein
MAYLSLTDYKMLIQDVIFQQIINNDDTTREQVELFAIAEARSYLIQKYLFDDELIKTGIDRDPQLLNYIIDIALYHLHSRIAPRNIPVLRENRYNNAVTWLKMCAMGDVTPKLALQPLTGKVIRWGSAPKTQNTY